MWLSLFTIQVGPDLIRRVYRGSTSTLMASWVTQPELLGENSIDFKIFTSNKLGYFLIFLDIKALENTTNFCKKRGPKVKGVKMFLISCWKGRILHHPASTLQEKPPPIDIFQSFFTSHGRDTSNPRFGGIFTVLHLLTDFPQGGLGCNWHRKHPQGGQDLHLGYMVLRTGGVRQTKLLDDYIQYTYHNHT